MGNKQIWAIIGTLFASISIGVLIIPVQNNTGMLQITNGLIGGVVQAIFLPTAAACFAFYRAFKSKD